LEKNIKYLIAEYDAGEELPAEEPLPLFQVSFSDGWVRESEWDPLPLTAEEESEIAGFFESASLDELRMVCRSIIPQLNGIVSGADELPELRILDEALTSMGDEELQKYKALLEIAKPENIGEAFRLADNFVYYNVELDYADPAAYGRQYYNEKCYHIKQHYSLSPFIDYAGFGAAMLDEDGYLSTRYGAVFRNAMAQKFLAGPNTVYSGDYYCGRTEGFPTCVCWDPDTQKVWLELNEYAADSEMVRDFAYYQGVCEVWGTRQCISREGYERVLADLGAQPYDEVMAEEQEQGFGGMGGIA